MQKDVAFAHSLEAGKNAKMLEHEEDISPNVIQMVTPIFRALGRYHDHEVSGIENIPRRGPAIIACNHSLATYDIALLFNEIYEQIGRIPRPLADHLFFKIPYLGSAIEELGIAEGITDNAHTILGNGELLGVAPGGMREALRPSKQKYQVFWKKRKGFARMAIETGAPVILAVCPAADDLFKVYESPLTAWAYKKFKLPVVLARGRGLSPIPRKIKLQHFLSEPMVPPKAKEDPDARQAQVNRFHKKIVKRAESLMAEAVSHSKV